MDILAGHPARLSPSRLVVHHRDAAVVLVLHLVLEDQDVLVLQVGQRRDVRLSLKEALFHDVDGLWARADTSQHMGLCAPLTGEVLGAAHLLSCGVQHLIHRAELQQQLVVHQRAQKIGSLNTSPAGGTHERAE